jgi:hypothetical protein
MSRPRGAVGSGAVAVESAAVSVNSVLVALSGSPAVVRVVSVCCGFGWMVVRFVCVIRVPVCARVSRVFPCVPRLPHVSLNR